ncbi:hypothetical protein [Streptomyces mangrovi]|uniref:hypothetical protein n=1 Tax=Streptomyces mangrovi TaxID=1206892 RepID=UPI00399CD9A3
MEFIDPLSSATEEAHVRSYVIRELKEMKIGESWSVSQLCRLVLNSIPYPLGDIREKASRWRELNREEMLTLRRIKNLLNTLKNVEDIVQQEGRGCEEVKEWLNVVPHLP